MYCATSHDTISALIISAVSRARFSTRSGPDLRRARSALPVRREAAVVGLREPGRKRLSSSEPGTAPGDEPGATPGLKPDPATFRLAAPGLPRNPLPCLSSASGPGIKYSEAIGRDRHFVQSGY